MFLHKSQRSDRRKIWIRFHPTWLFNDKVFRFFFVFLPSWMNEMGCWKLGQEIYATWICFGWRWCDASFEVFPPDPRKPLPEKQQKNERIFSNDSSPWSKISLGITRLRHEFLLNDDMELFGLNGWWITFINPRPSSNRNDWWSMKTSIASEEENISWPCEC